MEDSFQDKQWYLAVGDRSIGPLTTELVARGIKSGKVPLTAWACQVGATQWSVLSSFSEFHDITARQPSEEAQIPQHRRSRYGRSPFQMGNASFTGSDSTMSAPASERAQRADRASVEPELEESHDSELVESQLGMHTTSAHAPAEPVPPSSESAVHETALSQYDISATVTSSVAAVEEAKPTREPALLPYERVDRDESSFGHDDRSEASSVLTSAPPLQQIDEESDTGPQVSAALSRESDAAVRASTASEQHAQHEDLAIDVTFDEEHSINWMERFQSYFLVGAEVELPDETKLLQSLRETPRHIFLHDEALWNLSLCLAFGSDEVANTGARTFFDAIRGEEGAERVEWVCRTLLSKGFMPSGIPRSDGMRGIDVLRRACPAELRATLEREATD